MREWKILILSFMENVRVEIYCLVYLIAIPLSLVHISGKLAD